MPKITAPAPTSERADSDADIADVTAERRSFRPVSSVRQAVREDVAHVRDKAAERTEDAVDAIRDAPLKSVLYAAGIGVIIGLLLRR